MADELEMLHELTKASIEVGYMLYRGITRVESLTDRLDEAGISVGTESVALAEAMAAWTAAVNSGLANALNGAKKVS